MTNTKKSFSKRAKAGTKKETAKLALELAKAASSKLASQGDMIRELESENSEISWKSVIYNAPRGLLAFGTRAVTNTLASSDNLARWGKIVSPKCNQCGHIPCNLGHLLNMCL